jgi:hypothetical protein
MTAAAIGVPAASKAPPVDFDVPPFEQAAQSRAKPIRIREERAHKNITASRCEDKKDE